jgi:hypothetical protein
MKYQAFENMFIYHIVHSYNFKINGQIFHILNYLCFHAFVVSACVKTFLAYFTKKECLSFKGLEKTTLDFFSIYIIVIVLDFFMPINEIVSC